MRGCLPWRWTSRTPRHGSRHSTATRTSRAGPWSRYERRTHMDRPEDRTDDEIRKDVAEMDRLRAERQSVEEVDTTTIVSHDGEVVETFATSQDEVIAKFVAGIVRDGYAQWVSDEIP